MNSIEYIISPLSAWFAAQLLKVVSASIKNKKFDFERIFEDGGMPSAHSATVTALAVTCLLCFGFTSIYFAISAVFALVVMHDASGIRFESGKQAKAINQLHDHLQSLLQMPPDERLEELLGHTPLQVVMGALTGAIAALLAHII